MSIPTRTLHSSAAALALTLLASTGTAAQESRDSRIGVTAGVTFSKFGGQDAEGSKPQIGFAAGASLNWALGRFLAVEPQLLYALKGSRFSDASGSSSVLLGYLELPVVVMLRVPRTPGTRGVSPHIYAGGEIGYRIDCRLNTSSGGTAVSQTCGSLSEPPPRRLDGGLVFGAGVEIGRIRAGARFELGLTRLDSADPPNDIKNRSLFLLVGTRFPSFR